MSETTSILELPSDPVGGGNNIKLTANEYSANINTNTHTHKTASSVSLDESTINQIITGIQQASYTSATQLPSRDIPRTTDGIMQDTQVLPNYIPMPDKSQTNYIKDQEISESILNAYNKNLERNENKMDNLNDTYNEIQTPILLSVLYFLFQLPILKKNLFTYVPALFSKDGNYNINGYLFTSILFGLIFYILNKITALFNAF